MNLNRRKERLLIYDHQKEIAAIRANFASGIFQIGITWKLIIDGDDNCIVQHYNGAAWENLFKFVT